MANHMARIADFWGKKLEQPIDVVVAGEVKHHKCKFTEDGLYVWCEYCQEWEYDNEGILHDLLTDSAFVCD